MLKTNFFQTPLGLMKAVADKQFLYELHFIDSNKEHIQLSNDRTPIIDSIEKELEEYFAGSLHQFNTPVIFAGSPFQQRVWMALQEIPYGKTVSYAQLATAITQPSAARAVGSANGANKLAIIVPCHRVINATGALGGYAGGLERKQWLLEHEKKHMR
jgi:AraC family transcriptional regulator of adaptative response/methylated-DNA-[protein]-cysteine methyltransferase